MRKGALSLPLLQMMRKRNPAQRKEEEEESVLIAGRHLLFFLQHSIRMYCTKTPREADSTHRVVFLLKNVPGILLQKIMFVRVSSLHDLGSNDFS